MRLASWGLVGGSALAMLATMSLVAPTAAAKADGDFIVTAAPVYSPLAELRGAERFPKGAQLLLVRDGKAEPLVAGFADSADASVSFDGKRVLFAGKKAAADPWQIYELTLANGSVRKVMDTHSDAERPLYLPGGRMVWAQRTQDGFQLQSAEDGHPPKVPFLNPTAGPGVLPLTPMRANAFPAEVIADGRILFESGFPLGEGRMPELYLVYADGSGVEAYRCDHGRARWGGSQLASGDVIFTHGSTLARFTSALVHETPVAAPRAEYAGGIAETASGQWLLSARKAGEARYQIDQWKPGAASLQTVLKERGEDLVEPTLTAARVPPRRFPSDLHPWNYANLLALDSRLSLAGNLKQAPAAVRLETQDANGHVEVNGTAPVAPDGSFYVSVPPDRPIRFLLLDQKGAVIRREHGWFWVRAGEQRACVGCHTGPALSPENRVPEILQRSTTPFDLTGTSLHAAVQQGSPGGTSR
ncbi:MAG: hypothetical protein ACP5E5_03530 [Acidobacteriaceae bacterium]